MKPLVVYHDNCLDGFGAALCAWLKLGEQAEYVAVRYGQQAPDAAGRDVFIVDFCYPRETLQQMDERVKSMVVLDHHRTAKENADGLQLRNSVLRFDMQKSGARLAWDHFHGGEPPALVRYVEDSDLWTWRYPDTDAFVCALASEPRTFAAWKRILDMGPEQLQAFIARGRAMLDKIDELCKSVATNAFEVELDGVRGLAVNAIGALTSKTGNLLARKSGTFGLVWHVDAERQVLCSLRSCEPFEVEPLARRFGGGGHSYAAAFRLPAQRLPELLAGALRSEA